MRGVRVIIAVSALIIFSGCSVNRNYLADQKYAPVKLQSDYTLLRNILEAKHPSLYWYTPKDSMDYYFEQGYKSITDSMTELQFGWNILAPLLNKIHCGHTSFAMSKGWNKFIRNKKIPSLPLFIKTWNDTIIVTGNLNLKDSVLKRGTMITAINGIENKQMIHQMFNYLPQDGYENNINNLRLSTGFPFYHRNIYGLYKRYSVNYIDSLGKEKKTFISWYNPGGDSLKKGKDSLIKIPKEHIKRKRFSRRERLENQRNLKVDEKESIATISLYTFSKAHLKSFFRRSFRTLDEQHISNLVLDIRGNGGGDIGNYVYLTRYIRNTSFKVADTSFAKAQSLAPYTKYIRSGFFTNLGMKLFTHKKNDQYHFGFWERHLFKPKQNNHFDGNVFVLTNGFTFSASSLFCGAVKGQENVHIIGENTGGGWYGNSGIFIPEIILPNTKLKVRLPLFRIVQYDHVAMKGSGVLPDIRVEPTVSSIINNTDLKILKVYELIREYKSSDTFNGTPHSTLHQRKQGLL